MFMLNFDFFQPKKHRNDYSVGVLYLANLNLPRSMRFKWENIIVVGIIPGMDKEPGSLNEFLAPLVKDPHHQKDKAALERIQRKASRFVTGN